MMAIYRKITNAEHIKLRPDMYVGSVEAIQKWLWVVNDNQEMVYKIVTLVPALCKIFDEILVNAADNKIRDPKMNTIGVDIDRDKNSISIYNNGLGIPVVLHESEGIYIPELIFGHLLTSSNFNDGQLRQITGGRNGYGAKLANIFSQRFIVETANEGLKYTQTFTNNMTSKSEPKITSSKKEFTHITFYPDVSKFSLSNLDHDFVSWSMKRVYDIAGTTNDINVYFNGTQIPIQGFQEYIELFIKPGQKYVYAKYNDRWEIGLIISEGQFQQTSFVNNLCTSNGGTHVDYVLNKITKILLEIMKKTTREGNIKPSQVKNHIWIFIKCTIENPAFDSQAKQCLVSPSHSFGSEFEITANFKKKLIELGIIGTITTAIKTQEIKRLKRTDGSKRSRVVIAKLEDAHMAGTSSSQDCTLILTEGDSAKALAVAGLTVVGRDHYGIFPLRGKLLNVREAPIKQILQNMEIRDLKQILGLKENHVYESTRDLRYGHLLIMTDQDQDGSHIKGLIINFLDHFYPSLLKLPNFLLEFITPIVKATKTKGKKSIQKSFFTITEYEIWKETVNINEWTIKYYKGLGSSDNDEAKEYFGDLERHQKIFREIQPDEHELIDLAFSKKRADERKEWLRQYEPGSYMDYRLPLVTIDDFINKELILFSIADNVRSIPSLVDGLKLGQRKILFGVFKRKLNAQIKVQQLAGYVAEHSSYQHGESSLHSTIINLAQDYVGSNNLNLLNPHGQFGSRHQGGKDAAAARYLCVSPNHLLRLIFNPGDDHILNYLNEEGHDVQPEWYLPILPMVLVNGCEGIGSGWSSFIPNFNPRDIIENILRLMKGEEMLPMHPWYKGFKGTIEQINEYKYQVNGVIKKINNTSIEISELPIRLWTQTYKEQLTSWTNGTGNQNAWIKDFKEYHTAKSVKFIISVDPEVMDEIEKTEFQRFKAFTFLYTSNLVCFDAHGRLQKYPSSLAILKEFYPLRLHYYNKRKDFLLDSLQKQWDKANNKLRFVELVIQKKIVLDTTLEQVTSSLRTFGFVEHEYLLNLPINNLTKDQSTKLRIELKTIEKELETARKLTAENIWKNDLDKLQTELKEIESTGRVRKEGPEETTRSSQRLRKRPRTRK